LRSCIAQPPLMRSHRLRRYRLTATVPQQLDRGNCTPAIINYHVMNSVDEHVEKIKKAGGKIVAPKNEVPGQGWFAIFEDPSGTRLALWQQNPNAPQM